MECAWQNCSEKCQDLGEHLYYDHLESIPKDFGHFKCEWRNCNHSTVYKYKSHLTMHLRLHLEEAEKLLDKIPFESTQSSDEKTNELSFSFAKAVTTESDADADKDWFPGNDENHSQEDSPVIFLENEIICNEGDRLACPENSCNANLAPASLAKHLKRVHNRVVRVRVKCRYCQQAFQYQHMSRHVNGYCPVRGSNNELSIVVNEGDTVCPVQKCKKSFKKGIASHVKHYHKGMVPKVKCNQCKLPKHPLALQRHKLYSCPNRTALTVEVLSSNNMDRAVCPIENCKIELSAGGLASHLRKQHDAILPVQIKCKRCKKLLYPGMLQNHLMKNCLTFEET